MDFNELAQWAVIAFMAVYLVGLTRQLGAFLAPHAAQLTEAGPHTGKRVPDSLLPSTDLERLRGVAAKSVSGLAAIVVVDERCNSCHEILESVHSGKASVGLALTGLLKESSTDGFRQRARAAFELVFDDRTGERTQSVGIVGTPYAMVVDVSLVVRRKFFGPDLLEQMGDAFPTVPADDGGPFNVTVVAPSRALAIGGEEA